MQVHVRQPVERRTGKVGFVGVGLAAVSVAVVALLFVAVPAASAQTSLFYGMDEAPGATVMQGSGGAPNGTITGDVTLAVPGVTATGYGFNQNVGSCDSAFNITGTGYVQIPSSPAFSVGTQPFSFSVWLNTTTLPGADSGATKSCDFDVIRRSGLWKLELLPRGPSTHRYGAPHCQWNGIVNGSHVNVALNAGGSNVTNGAWHQITCARTAAGEQVIVDGVVKAASSVQVGTITTSASILVGRNPSGEDYYQGLLDDLTFTIG
jgi:hypothetical protein